MSPAEELRAAADKLRTHAMGAAEAPWAVNRWGNVESARYEEIAEVWHGDDNATYIAIMHPSVGLSVAAWLEDAAERIDEQPFPTTYPAATAVARLILGGDP